MLTWLAAAVLAGRPVETISIPEPRGRGRLTVQKPDGFTIRSKKPLIMALDGAILSISWTADRVTPVFLKAMSAYNASMRKQGNVIGPVAIGSYKGLLLRIPGKQFGYGLHAALVFKGDLLSFSYYDPLTKVAKSAGGRAMFQKLLGTAKILPK